MIYYLQPYWEYDPKTQQSKLLSVIVINNGRIIKQLRDVNHAKQIFPNNTLVDWNGTVIHEPVNEIIIEHYVEMIKKAFKDGEVNLVDVIAWVNGWNAIGKGEEMCVHYGDAEYHIWRKK